MCIRDSVDTDDNSESNGIESDCELLETMNISENTITSNYYWEVEEYNSELNEYVYSCESEPEVNIITYSVENNIISFYNEEDDYSDEYFIEIINNKLTISYEDSESWYVDDVLYTNNFRAEYTYVRID